MTIEHKLITGLDAIHPSWYISDTDPTNTLGANKPWLDITNGFENGGMLKIRDGANTAWIPRIIGDDWFAVNTGTGVTIDWRNGVTQRVRVTGAATITLGVGVKGGTWGKLRMIVEQDGTGHAASFAVDTISKTLIAVTPTTSPST